VVPKQRDQRLQFFRELAHVIHLGRCKQWPYGRCTRHEERLYFTPKDNDIASVVIIWLELIEGDIEAMGMATRFSAGGGDA
jgi:hypothetical protein